MTDFLSNHYVEILNALMLIVTGTFWIDAKKKKAELKQLNANAKGSEADATGKLMDLYQEALDDLKRRYEERIKDIQAQHDDKLAELEKKFNERFAELEEEIKRLRSNLELWKNKYRKLKEAFDKYREKHGDK